jgi:PAS domain S-box-containing protein
MPNNIELEKPNVLVVNDAPDILELMRVSLEVEGYRALTATSGRQALEIAKTHALDCVISDVSMPEMDGFMLCAELKKNPATASVPVLLASAIQMSSQDTAAGLAAGADDYLEMPFRQSELLLKLARLVERSQMEKALRESERRYRALYENSPLMYFLLDQDGFIVSVNERSVERLGYAREELIGKPVMEIFLPEDRLRLSEQIEKLRRSPERVGQRQFRKVTKSGRIIYVSENVRLLPQENGTNLFLVICEDITERVYAEQKTAALVEQLRATAERENLINRIGKNIRESLRVEDVFRGVVDELGKHLGVDRCHLYLFDEAAGVVRSRMQFAAPSVPRVSEDDVPSGLAQRILPEFWEKGFVAISDAANEAAIKELYEQVLQPRGVRSIMFVAVRLGEGVTGLLSLVMVNRQRTWTHADIDLACAVAEQAATAIRQAELYTQAEAVSQREKLINQISRAIGSSLQLSEVLQTATHELGKALNASRVFIRFFNAANPTALSPAQYVYTAPEAAGTPAPPPIKYQEQEATSCIFIENRRSIVIDDIAKADEIYEGTGEFFRKNIASRGVRSAVYYPICVKDDFRGGLCVEQTDCLRHWTENDVALIEAVAAQLSLGIAHAELFEITRRAKIEWEATFDAMTDGVFIFDHSGILRRVNRAGAAIEETVPSQLVGTKCCEILPSDDPANDACIISQVIESRASITIERFSKRLKRPFLISSEPVTESDGNLIGVVGTVRDLYELREAEAVARERQLLFTSVVEGMLEPVFAVGENGKFLWCNNTTRETFGIEAAKVTNCDFLEIIYPADREIAAKALRDSFNKLPQFYESRYFNCKNELRYAVFNSVPLVVKDKVNGVLWFVRDVTEQRQAVQQAAQTEKLRALGQLASGVAHDFNNVLATILGRVQLLQRGTTDKTIADNLKIIQTAAEDAAATVRRIQTFARQSPATDFSPIELNVLLEDSIEFTRTRWKDEAQRRGINYTVDLICDEKIRVFGNASELREVFVNLIINALDAMPSGGKLKIKFAKVENAAILEFTDEGTGVAPEIGQRVFEPFFTTKGVNGTGLGLSVSYGIIKNHSGTITVKNNDGAAGATFVITLPIQYEQTAPPKSNDAPTQAKKDLTVLVVDDEDFVRETLVEMMAELVNEVVSVNSSHSALEQLEKRRFDVVFTDLSMPEMDGWELAKKIRRNWGATKTVLVTGYGKGIAKTSEMRELVHAIISKPFNFVELSQTLEKITA